VIGARLLVPARRGCLLSGQQSLIPAKLGIHGSVADQGARAGPKELAKAWAAHSRCAQAKCHGAHDLEVPTGADF
jgi:hypothetical protein